MKAYKITETARGVSVSCGNGLEYEFPKNCELVLDFFLNEINTWLEEKEPSGRNALNLQMANDLSDWAESLICNAIPMAHCTQDDWDKAVQQWRDSKHSLFPDGPERARELQDALANYLDDLRSFPIPYEMPAASPVPKAPESADVTRASIPKSSSSEGPNQ